MSERPSPEAAIEDRAPRLRRTRELSNAALKEVQNGRRITVDTFESSVYPGVSLQEGIETNYYRLAYAYEAITGKTFSGEAAQLDDNTPDLPELVDIFTETARSVRLATTPHSALITASHIHDIGQLLKQPNILPSESKLVNDADGTGVVMSVVDQANQRPKNATEDTLPEAYYTTINRLSSAHSKQHRQFAETYIDSPLLKACAASRLLGSVPNKESLGTRAIIDMFEALQQKCHTLRAEAREEWDIESAEYRQIEEDLQEQEAKAISELPPKTNMWYHQLLPREVSLQELDEKTRTAIEDINKQDTEGDIDAETALMLRGEPYRNTIRSIIPVWVAARQAGVGKEAAVSLLYKHAKDIGKLTERAGSNQPEKTHLIDKTMDDFDPHSATKLLAALESMKLTVTHDEEGSPTTKLTFDHIEAAMGMRPGPEVYQNKMRKRDETGGICPFRNFTQGDIYPRSIKEAHEKLEEEYQVKIPLFTEGQGMHNGTLQVMVAIIGMQEAGVFSELEEHPKFREVFVAERGEVHMDN